MPGIGAFRYYLGTSTYAVDNFCQLLIKEWPKLDKSIRYCIEKELEYAFTHERNTQLGMQCDMYSWQKVRDLYLKNQL
jgi:hypothetical protein